MVRRSLSRWLGKRLAAAPVLAPYPGWVLGAGEKQGIRARARRQFWRWLRAGFEVEWLEGLRLRLLPRNEISRAIFVTGRYEPNEFCWLSRVLKPGMTFVDVGANMGLYSLFAARRVTAQGQVLAVEPSSRECEILEGNIKSNALQNVRTVKAAVSNRRGKADLLVAPLRNSGHNTLGRFGYGTTAERTEPVPTERLDDILQTVGFDRVDVIKMDVEGAEMLALRGATETLRRFHPLLLLEVSDRTLQHQSSSSREVLDFLVREGYRFYGFDPRSGLPQPQASRPHFDSENIVAVAGESVPW
ncbi:MAG: FkbM family methyltransferase [Terriglobales bacterium]